MKGQRNTVNQAATSAKDLDDMKLSITPAAPATLKRTSKHKEEMYFKARGFLIKQIWRYAPLARSGIIKRNVFWRATRDAQFSSQRKTQSHIEI